MAKRLNYQIGVTADTSQFNAALQQSMQLLNRLGTQSSMVPSLQQASRAAMELRRNLEAAVNPSTGNLDISRFAEGLSKGGANAADVLARYRTELSRFGPEGQRAFLNVANSIMTAEVPLKRSNKLMNELWTTMKNTMRWQLTSSTLHAFVGQIEQAYGYAKSLDTSLNNIRIVTSKTADDMRSFAEYANQAARALSTTTTDYTDASLIYYQQGLSDEEVRGRTETTVKMANVSRQSADIASQQLTAIWNNFYDGSKSLDYYADVLVKLGAATASSSDEIAEGVQRFAAVANTVGLSYEYAASALATLTANTRESASVVGTALRTLFTRFQGLQLGETLEDGLDLNKYSKALDKVGVSILDQNGEMKEMDAILDGIAEKWTGLTKAQQMALAQTVAGVRQYTQFIGLMENWDDFQSNLQMSYEAGGSLDEQQEIYAESWEAARDRVKAAAEDIYDSLINPEAFIALDEALTPILGTTANIVDAMGGLSGVLSGVAILINKVYGSKIAEAMRNMAYNIRSMTGEEAKRAKALRESAATQAKQMMQQGQAAGRRGHQVESQRLTAMAQIVNLEGQAAEYATKLNSAQTQQVQGVLNELKARRDIINTMTEQHNRLQEQSEAQTRGLVRSAARRDNTDWRARLQTQMDETPRGGMTRALGVVLNNSQVNSGSDAVRALIGQYQGAIREQQRWDALHQEFTRSAVRENGQVSESVVQLARDFGLLGDALDGLVDSPELFGDIIEEQLENSSEVVDGLAETLETFNTSDEFSNAVAELGETFEEMARTEGNITSEGARLAAEAEDTQRRMADGSLGGGTPGGWADSLVEAGTKLSEISMGISAIQGLGDIFTNEDMSAAEKFTATLMSLSMVLPAVASAMSVVTAVRNLDVGASLRQIATSRLNVEANTMEGMSNLAVAKMIAVKTAAKIKDAAVNHPVITAAIMGVVALAAGITALSNHYAKASKEAQKMNEALEGLTSQADEAKSEAEALRNSIESYDSAVDTLNDCTKGTEEWNDALKQVNETAIEVLNNVGQISPEELAGLRDETTGLLNMDKLSAIQQRADSMATQTSYAASTGEYAASLATQNAQAVQLGREMTFGADGYGAAEVIMSHLEELSNASASEFEEIFARFGVRVDATADSIALWQDRIRQMASSVEGASEKLETIAALNVETLLGNEYSKSVKDYVTSMVAQGSEEGTKQWQRTMDKMTKISDAKDPRYQEILGVLQAAGYDLHTQSINAVRGTDANRQLAFLDAAGKEVVFGAEQLASMLAAAEAFNDVSANAEAAQKALVGLSGAELDLSMTLMENYDPETGFDTGIAEFLGEMTQAEIDNIEQTLLAQGITAEELDEVAALYEKTGQDIIDAIIRGAKEGAGQLTPEEKARLGMDDEGVYRTTFKNLTASEGKAHLDARDAAMESISDLSQGTILMTENGINQMLAQNMDKMEGVNAYLEKMGELDLNVEGSVEQLQAIERAYGLSGSAFERLKRQIEELPTVYDVATDGIVNAYNAAKEAIDGIERGQIIEPEGVTALEEAGVNMSDFFVETSDGVWKLVSDAEALAKAVDDIKTDKLDNQLDDFYRAAENAYRASAPEKDSSAFYSSQGGTQGHQDLAYMSQLDTSGMELSSEATALIESYRELGNSLHLVESGLVIIQEAMEQVASAEFEAQRATFMTASSFMELEQVASQAGLYLRQDYGDALVSLASQYEHTTQEVDEYRNALSELLNLSNDATQAEREAAEAAYNSAEMNLQVSTLAGELAEKYNLSAESIRDVANEFQELAEAGDEQYVSLKDNANLATDSAVAHLRLNEAVLELAENQEDYIQILKDYQSNTKKADKATLANEDSCEDLRKSLAKLLNVTEDMVDADLLDAIDPDDFNKAAKGDEAAIERIRKAYIDLEAQAHNADVTPDLQVSEQEIAEFKNMLDSLADGTVININTSPFLQKLIEAAMAAGATAADIENMLTGFGIDADVTPFYGDLEQAVAASGEASDQIIKNTSFTQEADVITANEPTPQQNVEFTESLTPVTMTGSARVLEQGPEGDISSKSVPFTYVAAKKSVAYNVISENATTSVTAQSVQTKNGAGRGGQMSGAKINARKSNASVSPSTAKRAGRGGGGGGGGGGGAPKEAEIKGPQKREVTRSRYHKVDRAIADQDNKLTELETQIERTYGTSKINAYTRAQDALNKQIDNFNDKLQEAEKYLIDDKEALNKFLKEGKNAEIEVDVTANGNLEIINFDELEDYEHGLAEAAYLKWDDFIQNTWDKMSGAEQEANQERYETEEKAFKDSVERYEEWEEMYAQYEETLDYVNEQHQSILDAQRQIADFKLQQINYKLQVVLDVKDMRNALEEFWQEFYEMQGDYLSHFQKLWEWNTAQVTSEVEMFDDYEKKWQGLQDRLLDPMANQEEVLAEIQDLQGQILESASAIIEWANTIEEIIPEAVSAAAERFALFTDQLDHNTSILETIKELYTLQGVTNKTRSGLNTIWENYSQRLEAQTANAALQKKWADEAEQRLVQAQQELDAYLAAGGTEDNEYDRLKMARDAYLEQFNEAQEAYLSLAQEAMETAQEMYLEKIAHSVYQFGQVISDGIGLDLLQDKYDHYIEQEERYLDKVNKAYEVASWFNKLQADIDEATNASTRERLKNLQEEINIRRENGKLSQYDLDILEAKYNLTQAQIALEEAQNAKNNLQLVRDRQGNWNYQYTANPEDVEQAEKDMIDAQNEWYNIAKDRVKETTGEIVSAWAECQEAVQEVYEDMTLTDQERANKAQEIYSYYTEKIKFLEEEKQVAIADMTQAGNESLLTSAILTGDTITDLTGLTSEDIQKIVSDSGENIIGILSGNNETIQNIVASNTDLIDLFDNVYAEDLDHMTDNTAKFESELDRLLGQCEDSYQEYQDKVKDVADETGTSLRDLNDITKDVADSNDELRDRGSEAALALWEQVSAAEVLSDQLSVLAQQYLAVAQNMALMAQDQHNVADSAIDRYNKDVDYNALIQQGLAEGYLTYGDATFNQLVDYRNNKISDAQVFNPGLDPLIQGQEALDYWKGIEEGDTNHRYKEIGSEEDFKKWLEQAFKINTYDTGGYTGHFDDTQLAFLHEKELVLNQEDTSNILAAVGVVRTLGPELFASIERALDSSVAAGNGLMSERFNNPSNIQPVYEELQQEVRIEAVFPNATNHDEIEMAFANLANDASQYIRRRTE